MVEDRVAIESRATVAKAVVDRLLAIASGMESEEWLAKHVAVQQALAYGKFREAYRQDSKLVDYRIEPKWVVSRELAKTLKAAIGNLARELGLPNGGETEIRFDELPTDVTELGTIDDEVKRSRRDCLESFKRDPLEEDPRFAEVLKAASEEAQKALAEDPLGGMSFIYWAKKKEILRQQYGLDWRTPMELNPDMMICTS